MDLVALYCIQRSLGTLYRFYWLLLVFVRCFSIRDWVMSKLAVRYSVKVFALLYYPS